MILHIILRKKLALGILVSILFAVLGHYTNPWFSRLDKWNLQTRTALWKIQPFTLSEIFSERLKSCHYTWLFECREKVGDVLKTNFDNSILEKQIPLSPLGKGGTSDLFPTRQSFDPCSDAYDRTKCAPKFELPHLPCT